MRASVGWTTARSFARGIHVGFWVVLDAILAAVLLGVLWWERGKPETLRPAIICAVAFAISTAASYFVMTEFYFSR
ncbi:MAG: hypothetical protein WDO17_21330 [Alphaproteobacteria bacterium]